MIECKAYGARWSTMHMTVADDDTINVSGSATGTVPSDAIVIESARTNVTAEIEN